MEYFTEQAPTYSECMRRIKSKYGDSAKVLMQRSVRIGGVLGFFSREGVEMSGIVGPESLRPQADASRQIQKATDLEEEKKKFIANLKGDQTLQLVLNEVRSIKEKIDAVPSRGQGGEDHGTVLKIEELMDLNDFSPAFTRSILDRLKREFSLEALDDYDSVQDRVVEWIGEALLIHPADPGPSRPRVMVLVGPTGVGKTTTIAKLAAIFGIGGAGTRPLSVRIVTIDNYRIGAKNQIETYGSIMGIPVSSVETFDDLKKTIAMYAQDVDLILVDTIGKSPREYMRLAEMKELLTACGHDADTHLALSATTKASDMREILQQFEPFGYRSVIVTKLDETVRVGNIISILSEKGKAVSYLTDGQRVPQDISRATTIRFLMNLEGFRIDRRRLGERFGEMNAEKNKWR